MRLHACGTRREAFRTYPNNHEDTHPKREGRKPLIGYEMVCRCGASEDLPENTYSPTTTLLLGKEGAGKAAPPIPELPAIEL